MTTQACLGDVATGDDSCEEGYKGPLCAVCKSGFAPGGVSLPA